QNDPVNRTDPSGRFSIVAGLATGAGAAAGAFTIVVGAAAALIYGAATVQIGGEHDFIDKILRAIDSALPDGEIPVDPDADPFGPTLPPGLPDTIPIPGDVPLPVPGSIPIPKVPEFPTYPIPPDECPNETGSGG